MQDPSHDEIEELLRHIVLPFYHIKREMPLPVGERRWENDAEHSWSVAFLACALAPLIDETLDVGKVAQLAIAHDIVEVFAGDVSVFGTDDELGSKAEREAAAAEKISQDFSHFPWIVSTLHAYEAKESNEAKFVYAIDKYITVMYDYIDGGKYLREAKYTQAIYHKTLASHREKAQNHQEVGKYYDEVRALLDAHPEYFHQESTDS